VKSELKMENRRNYGKTYGSTEGRRGLNVVKRVLVRVCGTERLTAEYAGQ